jgi:hypothetical protein
MAKQSERTRRHPRIAVRTLVELRVAAITKSVWITDISKGGVFLSMADPPPSGTEIVLGFAVGEGARLALRAIVRRTVTGEDPGAGVEFLSLEASDRRTLEEYVEELEGKRGIHTGDIASAPSEAAEVLRAAREVLRGLVNDDVYSAIGLSPTASDVEIEERAAALRELLELEVEGLTLAQRASIAAMAAQVVRIAKLLADPMRRLDYDFRHGNLRVEERVEEASNGGPSLEMCREAWKRLFPDKVELAKTHMREAFELEARASFAEAARSGRTALELDPFDARLLDVVPTWESRARKRPLLF